MIRGELKGAVQEVRVERFEAVDNRQKLQELGRVCSLHGCDFAGLVGKRMKDAKYDSVAKISPKLPTLTRQMRVGLGGPGPTSGGRGRTFRVGPAKSSQREYK